MIEGSARNWLEQKNLAQFIRDEVGLSPLSAPHSALHGTIALQPFFQRMEEEVKNNSAKLTIDLRGIHKLPLEREEQRRIYELAIRLISFGSFVNNPLDQFFNKILNRMENDLRGSFLCLIEHCLAHTNPYEPHTLVNKITPPLEQLIRRIHHTFQTEEREKTLKNIAAIILSFQYEERAFYRLCMDIEDEKKLFTAIATISLILPHMRLRIGSLSTLIYMFMEIEETRRTHLLQRLIPCFEQMDEPSLASILRFLKSSPEKECFLLELIDLADFFPFLRSTARSIYLFELELLYTHLRYLSDQARSSYLASATETLNPQSERKCKFSWFLFLLTLSPPDGCQKLIDQFRPLLSTLTFDRAKKVVRMVCSFSEEERKRLAHLLRQPKMTPSVVELLIFASAKEQSNLLAVNTFLDGAPWNHQSILREAIIRCSRIIKNSSAKRQRALTAFISTTKAYPKKLEERIHWLYFLSLLPHLEEWKELLTISTTILRQTSAQDGVAIIKTMAEIPTEKRAESLALMQRVLSHPLPPGLLPFLLALFSPPSLMEMEPFVEDLLPLIQQNLPNNRLKELLQEFHPMPRLIRKKIALKLSELINVKDGDSANDFRYLTLLSTLPLEELSLFNKKNGGFYPFVKSDIEPLPILELLQRFTLKERMEHSTLIATLALPPHTTLLVLAILTQLTQTERGSFLKKIKTILSWSKAPPSKIHEALIATFLEEEKHPIPLLNRLCHWLLQPSEPLQELLSDPTTTQQAAAHLRSIHEDYFFPPELFHDVATQLIAKKLSPRTHPLLVWALATKQLHDPSNHPNHRYRIYTTVGLKLRM